MSRSLSEVRSRSFTLLGLIFAGGCTVSAGGFFPDAGGDGGPGSILVSSDGGTSKKDSGKKDAAIEDPEDPPPELDAGKKDSGKKDSAPPLAVCAPGSIAGFAPVWKAPKALHTNACTATNAQLVVDCTFDSTVNPTTCDTFMQNTANDACVKCVLTDATSAQLGPIILDGTSGRINVAGCIAALSGNTTATGCGAKVQAYQGCTAAACASCTDPTTSSAAAAEYDQCVADSESSPCSTYTSDAACADPLLQAGGAAASCAAGNTFLDNARTVAKLFCTL